MGDQLRARGNEYGAVTGRPRRCGWLDIPLLRYSNQVNGAEWLVITKLDVLDELEEIPICVGYEIEGRVTDEIPADVLGLGADQAGLYQDEGLAELDRGDQGVRQIAPGGKRVSALSGTGERGQNRNGIDRPGSGPDNSSAGICRGSGKHSRIILKSVPPEGSMTGQ